MADIICKDPATREALRELIYAVMDVVTDGKPHRRRNRPHGIARLERALNKLADLSIGG